MKAGPRKGHRALRPRRSPASAAWAARKVAASPGSASATSGFPARSPRRRAHERSGAPCPGALRRTPRPDERIDGLGLTLVRFHRPRHALGPLDPEPLEIGDEVVGRVENVWIARAAPAFGEVAQVVPDGEERPAGRERR